MAPARSKRRKSTAQAAPPTFLDEDALRAIWVDQKQTYRAPSPQPLETIFESIHDHQTPPEETGPGVRPARRTRGGQRQLLEVGKYLQRRALDPPKYWLEDKEKTRHRKKMAQTAAHQGQKKFKLVALSQEQENALRAIIENQPVDSGSEDEAHDATDASARRGVAATPRKTPTPMTPPLPRTPLATPSSFFSPQVASSTRKKGSNRRRSNLLKLGVPVLGEPNQSHGSPSLWPPVFSHHISTSQSSQSTDPGFVIPNEEIRRQIEEADSFFGMIPGTETPRSEIKSGLGIGRSPSNSPPPNSTSGMASSGTSSSGTSGTAQAGPQKGRRATISVKVRRSSRLFKGAEHLNAVGSIFQVAEIEEKPTRIGRTLPLVPPHLISWPHTDPTPEPRR